MSSDIAVRCGGMIAAAADERYRGLAAIKASPAAAINTSLAAAAAAINTSPSAAAAAINTSPAFPAAAINICAATSGIAGRQEGVSRYTSRGEASSAYAAASLAPASISTNAFLAASHAAGVIEAAAIGPCRQALSTTIAAALVPLASFKAAAAASASEATAASGAAKEEETAEGLQPRLGRPALDAFSQGTPATTRNQRL
ncbi:hypothetical protein L249_8721 [Ophiocordyceps polyrhachis-furcata BCC 54312]|uniref:Uncharacterized protein n=1 Tax=Ophiocordyceps polyrhachis-furcata BCC 54312 TaxID=1330021 RepID=A0A367L726_9HYPO|nr:hypothetical protein L249_8721 [Ophiocordyceps polyrhachis-furcata BCC 54312]